MFILWEVAFRDVDADSFHAVATASVSFIFGYCWFLTIKLSFTKANFKELTKIMLYNKSCLINKIGITTKSLIGQEVVSLIDGHAFLVGEL